MDNKTNKPTHEQLEALAAEQDALLLSYAKLAGNNAAKVQQLEAQLAAAEKRNEELEAQVKQLASEGAGLKDITAWCHTEAFINMYREYKIAEAAGCEPKDCMHDAMLTALMHAPEAPTTDAYLSQLRNEARSEGLDEMARVYRGWADEERCSHNMQCSYRLTAERAESYAAYIRRELREGKAGEVCSE